jgi:hypothetical protein
MRWEIERLPHPTRNQKVINAPLTREDYLVQRSAGLLRSRAFNLSTFNQDGNVIAVLALVLSSYLPGEPFSPRHCATAAELHRGDQLPHRLIRSVLLDIVNYAAYPNDA